MFQVFLETPEARSRLFCQRFYCFVLRNRSFQMTGEAVSKGFRLAAFGSAGEIHVLNSNTKKEIII